MSRVREKPWLAAGVLSVTLAAAVGFGIGAAAAGSEREGDTARQQAYDAAYGHSLAGTRQLAAARGLREGKGRGRLTGRRAGRTEGFDLGGGIAGLDLAEGQVEAAQSAKLTAEAELAERQANCGSILRAPDICPTDAELAEYRAALAEAKKPARPKQPGGGQQRQRPGGRDG